MGTVNEAGISEEGSQENGDVAVYEVSEGKDHLSEHLNNTRGELDLKGVGINMVKRHCVKFLDKT